MILKLQLNRYPDYPDSSIFPMTNLQPLGMCVCVGGVGGNRISGGNFHPLLHTQYIHAHLPFSAHLSKHQTLADSGGSFVLYLLWAKSISLSPVGPCGVCRPAGISVSPRPTNRLPHMLQHLPGFGSSLKGMNWICSEWGVMQWGQLGRAAILYSIVQYGTVLWSNTASSQTDIN